MKHDETKAFGRKVFGSMDEYWQLMKGAFDAVIFDFDGTIALSEIVHKRAWEDLAADYQLELPEGFLEKGVGHTDSELAADLALQWSMEEETRNILELKRRYFHLRARREALLVPGINEFLSDLDTHFLLAVATSATLNDVLPVLQTHNLQKFFPVINTVDDVQFAKPDPEIYLKTAHDLGVSAKRCLVFEDSPAGVTAARVAGMKVIGLLTTFPEEQLRPLWQAIPDYNHIHEVLWRCLNGDL